jgi:NTE family protein
VKLIERLSFFRRPRPGLVFALGGGGARGLAHLGVLEVVEDLALPVNGIAGTSAGAVIGAMWLVHGSAADARTRWSGLIASGLVPAALPDIRLAEGVSSRDNLLLQFARRLRRGAVVALALGRPSLITSADLEKAIAFLVPDIRIEELPKPFVAVATDFDTGAPVTIRRGPLRAALTASSSVPAAVPPYRIGPRTLLDGGVVADLPVAQARELRAGPVVVVDVGDDVPPVSADRLTMPQAMLRAGAMTHQVLRQLLALDADLVLRPEVVGIHWSEFARGDDARRAGVEEARRNQHVLRRLAGGGRLRAR